MNGGARPGAGRPKGSKSPATLEREAALKTFRDMVFEQVQPFFLAQAQLAKSTHFVFTCPSFISRTGKASSWIEMPSLATFHAEPMRV
jgi:hypothetical protein